MGLGSVVRNALKLADKITDDLQPAVLHHAWIGNDSYSAPTYAAAVSRPAIIIWKQQLRRDLSGELKMSRASVFFPRPIPANGAAGRSEPIDPRDKIVLPDGTTGPILDITGMVDKGTGSPYYAEVFLG